MAQVNSSLEALTYNTESYQKTLDIDVEPEKIQKVPLENQNGNHLTTKHKAGHVAGFLQNFHDGAGTILKNNRRSIQLSTYSALYGFLIGYFAWATWFFIEKSEETVSSSACTGYGFLMILFIFINFGVFYYWIFKPLLLSSCDILFWNPISKRISKLLSVRFVVPVLYLLIFAAIIVYVVYDSRNNWDRLIPASGLVIYLALGFLFSSHPGHINWRPVIWGLLLQFGFGLLTIKWDVGRNIFDCLGNKTTTFLGYATSGAAFVYGDVLIYKLAVFAFQVLSTIYFLGFMVNILYHYGIMQKIVVTIGEFLQGVMGTTICESVNCAANIFLGMSESPLLLKPYLTNLTASEIHSIMTSGFATVSGTVLAAYISFGANASHLITASVMSAPAALCYSKLLYPETEETVVTKEAVTLVKSEYSSVLDAATKGASLALEVVLGIIANVIAFIALIYFLNGIVGWMGELVGYSGDSAWTVEDIVGYLFMPVSFVMGVPWAECRNVGRLIGLKTIVNEFVAFKELGEMELSPRTRMIATYAICGFSNPGSIGITISTLSVLMPNKRHYVTKLVFRAFVAGAIVCFMTASIAAMVYPDDL